MSRKTHLDVSAYSIGAVDYLGLFKATSFDISPTIVEGKAVSQRHNRGVLAKRKFTFTTDELLTATGLRQTALNLTVFSVGGTSYLGEVKSGSLKISTTVKDGSGAADEWESPVAVGTAYEIQGKLQIASTAEFMVIAGGTGTGLSVATSLALGGSTFTAPMILSKSTHTIDVDDIQGQDITLTSRGLPTVATGNSVLASIALGTSLLAFDATTGAAEYAGNAIVSEVNIQFSDGQIISASHSFACIGAPTIS